MSGRIEATFERLRDKRAALIPFIMGYHPDQKTTSDLLAALPDAGADIIEIGMPFSDPMADGPVIQGAGEKALKKGATVAGILELVKAFRISNQETPVILMGYYNPVYRYGEEAFCRDATAAGVDGIIIVDLPPEEEGEIRPALTSIDMKLIRLIAPTSNDVRLSALTQSASGFVYYISVLGITGVKSADEKELEKQVAHLREFTPLPVAVGFGIKTYEQVKAISAFSDAVVVGSALVDMIDKATDGAQAVSAACDFVRQLAKGLPR